MKVVTEQRLAHERGYSVLLFMIVDILELRSRILIWGGERVVVEVLGVSLEADGHSVLVEGLGLLFIPNPIIWNRLFVGARP